MWRQSLPPSLRRSCGLDLFAERGDRRGPSFKGLGELRLANHQDDVATRARESNVEIALGEARPNAVKIVEDYDVRLETFEVTRRGAE